jgi:hypothetical protein
MMCSRLFGELGADLTTVKAASLFCVAGGLPRTLIPVNVGPGVRGE